MNNLKEILLSELPNFREKSLKFLNGEISKPEYMGKNYDRGNVH